MKRSERFRMSSEKIDIYTLVDTLVTHLEGLQAETNRRIKELEESSGLVILDEIDPENYYKHGQLAQSKGGLFRYDANEESWHVLVNSIDTVSVEETPMGAAITFKKSNGDEMASFLKFPQRPASKAAKAA